MDRRRSQRPQRVLVVDDSRDIRELWSLWLSFWGFDVEEAQNGFEAVQKARAHPPALILMDLWMPVLNGMEATAQLKALPETAHVPVLALSAQASLPTRRDAVEGGCDAFLPKPVDPDQLLEQVRALMAGRATS